jgi:hypothetical protein
LFNSVFGEIYDSFQLGILGHHHESQGCFCHCGDWCFEDGIRSIVEFVVEVAWREMSTFGRASPAHIFALIPFPAGCTSDFVFINWSVLGQIVC